MPLEVGVGWTVTHFQLKLGLAPNFSLNLSILCQLKDNYARKEDA